MIHVITRELRDALRGLRVHATAEATSEENPTRIDLNFREGELVIATRAVKINFIFERGEVGNVLH